MSTQSNVAMIASLVSEPSRAAILTALLDGRFHTASELAHMAGIKPQTASFHLAKMTEAQVITVEKQGRHRYYGIQDPEVAQVMESLLSIAPPVPIKSFKQASENEAIRLARTCYDHVAGHLGVQIMSFFMQKGILSEDQDGLHITQQGEIFFADFQINLKNTRQKRRSFSHKCLDWSERRHHLAGALGSALLDRLFELHWVEHLPTTRAIRITAEGKRGFKEVFSIEIG
ncbi:ArsR/SmtB family transcription factor [Paenibacillus polymyxa]|jgi:DNA-binding transcriptional ArsR family regulator|uniref:ArsR/SmtB family transcription factor n=1 Tax=Paenibacillus TaxID=44249 RepID=UPI000C9F3836|nr:MULTISPECIES: winged helix-turn-helix domain-containing protein [Paenibacillus]KAF6653839.1 winged helix-turn-helix transcriptional regulator [Paenibacillus sp. EKM301P]MBE3649760.1 winged helix-turn-helix transcriptional regulator [Paenibacillus polymyxa]MBY0022455.1 winged helix-turn-helix transcriptional regulator [Paenibacillus polymyxa]MBY0058577.1 winged helix-turn-helix transcriptional regulator [Paenibacillus polymyxa]MBY0072114.1 winged helix-turn-helix transcriptional regulator [P